jgi:predicted TIM-barrel fold metal-dependent hydrolase
MATNDTNPRRIDVHHHVLPPTYKTRARAQLAAGTSASDDLSFLFDWTPEAALAEMDKHGIATAIGSISTPGVWFGDQASGRSLARECNEYMAEMGRKHPGRFGFFAAVPLPDEEGSLSEIAYALDTLKADGVGILTSYGDKWPGDPAFARIFDELNRRKAVVFVHPTAPSCCVGLIPGVHMAITEFVFDTTRAITSFLVNGTFQRCPDIRFIFCHAGGTMMPIAYRVAGWASRTIAAQVPKGVLYELQRLYYDIAGAANPASIAAVRAIVPLTQLLFGTDNPYVPIAATAMGTDKFGFTPEEARAINRDNALRLFPRLGA